MLARDLSVVIPHYGDPGPTRALVAALRDQETAVGRLQIVVSDDASPTPFPPLEGVEVVRRDENGGFGSAVNTGVRLAVHPLLLVLNSDLEVPPTFLADLLDAATPMAARGGEPPRRRSRRRRPRGPGGTSRRSGTRSSSGSRRWPGRGPGCTRRSVTTPARSPGRTPSSTG